MQVGTSQPERLLIDILGRGAQAEQAIHGTKVGPSMAQICLSHPYPERLIAALCTAKYKLNEMIEASAQKQA